MRGGESAGGPRSHPPPSGLRETLAPSPSDTGTRPLGARAWGGGGGTGSGCAGVAWGAAARPGSLGAPPRCGSEEVATAMSSRT